MHKFIKEVLRMYSPAIFGIFRTCAKDHFINRFKIKKGTMSTAFISLNCFKEEFFEDSFKFKPERWDKNVNGD